MPPKTLVVITPFAKYGHGEHIVDQTEVNNLLKTHPTFVVPVYHQPQLIKEVTEAETTGKNLKKKDVK